ncbi:MAG TPA: TIGR04295 family B12-binding domain-containing radical SAM protein [Bryobacteraceae bacterium]|nr:TIGR04295 family B12-binding domain-containing radical SAM protein [Bryobacteraceae bacterium]
MRYALINPNWSFEGSIYFGCREPHLPLEFGYSKTLLEAAGHEAIVIDGQLDALTPEEIRLRIIDARPDFSVITTAPSYLFWRCAPPELRVPRDLIQQVGDAGGKWIAVGPHASTTPKTTLRKLGVHAVVMGECEEILPQFAGPLWQVQSVCYSVNGDAWIQGGTHASDMTKLPALRWPLETVSRHNHHHHRFEASPKGPGAELESSRGCPYHCTFCAKDNFRDKYRRRPVSTVMEEIDGLLEQGVEYFYFIDEIFLPNKELLEGLVERRERRDLKIGLQTRIDLWSEEMLTLLGRAGCVSIEAGVESITEEGRAELDKKCKMTTQQLADRLIFAKQHVPFVQANLIEMEQDDLEAVDQFRDQLQQHGVWANKPVPLYPYPGSPDYTKRWGQPDENAWERAHDYYLQLYAEFSDIQESQPRPLRELELSCA